MRKRMKIIAATVALLVALAAIASAYNPLEGKVLVAAGDSLTAGFGLTPDPVTGQMPTYPMIVGSRNNMQVYNIAINGAWMTSARYGGADVEGFSSYFDEEGFLSGGIDYLTINLGANDWSYGLIGLMDDYCLANFETLYLESTAQQQAEAEAAEDWIGIFIGSKYDMDTSTWYGAWNTVLTYLRMVYPLTKVGILVPYPSQDVDSEFAARLRETLFEIADSFGCPALDCGDSSEWFCIGYARGLDPGIGDMLAMVYTIDYVHPNALGHEQMADSYEAWLRRI